MKRCEWCDGPVDDRKHGVRGRKRFCTRDCQLEAYYYERKARESERAL